MVISKINHSDFHMAIFSYVSYFHMSELVILNKVICYFKQRKQEWILEFLTFSWQTKNCWKIPGKFMIFSLNFLNSWRFLTFLTEWTPCRLYVVWEKIKANLIWYIFWPPKNKYQSIISELRRFIKQNLPQSLISYFYSSAENVSCGYLSSSKRNQP